MVIFCQHSNLRFLKSESYTEENQDIEWKIVTDRHTHFSVDSFNNKYKRTQPFYYFRREMMMLLGAILLASQVSADYSGG